MKHFQKSLSLFLCIVMCLSIFPFSSAFAEEVESEDAELISLSDELERSCEELEEEPEQTAPEADTPLEEQEELQHEHSYTAVVTAPTCTEQGFTTYTCACDDSYVDDYIEPLNHPEIIDVPEVSATETEPGITAGKKCALCGEIIEGCEEIPALEETTVIEENQAEKDSLNIEKEEEESSVSETIVEEDEETLARASYPSCFFCSDPNFENVIIQDYVEIGSIYPIRMKWFAEYNNEGYDITIYDSNKNVVGTSSDTWRNSSYLKHITITWDTKNCEPGRYTVEVVKKFYSLFRWNEAPTTSTLWLQLVNPGEIPPRITKQPQSVTVKEGHQATFSVVASGTGLSYQWIYIDKNGKWVDSGASGNKTPTLTITATPELDGTQFFCVVKSSGGEVSSNRVTLTVEKLLAPTITSQPKSTTVNADSQATFTVGASGEELSYQWIYIDKNGKWVNSGASGNKTPTLTITATPELDGTQFFCVVKNSAGEVYSNRVTLTVNKLLAPTITSQPKSTTVNVDSQATFTVGASGEKLSYQWIYIDKNGKWVNSGASGNKTPTLTITATPELDGMQFFCVVKNSAGEVYSNRVTLTVIPKVTFYLTLNMADFTGVYVYVGLPEGVNASEYTIEASGSSYRQSYTKAPVRLNTLPQGSGSRSGIYQFEAMRAGSPEMTDEVTVTLKKGNTVVRTETYSVYSVAQGMLAGASLTSDQVNLIKALLQYGYYGHYVFNNPLNVNPYITGAPTLTAIPSTYAAKGDPTNFGAYVTSFTEKLNLDSAIGMNLYLTLASGYSMNDFTYNVLDKDGNAYDNWSVSYEGNNQVSVKINGIKSPQMARNFKLIVTLKNNTAKTATWTRSVWTCAYEGSARTSGTGLSFLRALYQYGVYAQKQFPNVA